MNIDTGEIKTFEEMVKIAKDLRIGWFEIPKKFINILLPMSKEERIKFYKDHQDEWTKLLALEKSILKQE